LSALAFARMSRAFGLIKRHYGAIITAGGTALVVMGVLLWTGELFQLNIEAQRLLDRLGLDFFSQA
jgi:cytochrome c-type biogenesis protein